MKFEMGNNDSLPFIEVVMEGEGLIVRFWGFSWDEANQWFKSAPLMDSLSGWHSLVGDFEMSVNCKHSSH